MKETDGVRMPKSYVDFEVSNEVVAKTYEALQLAKQTGNVRKGANEVTKSIERGLARLVVIAADVEPEEVVVHIPSLCRQKKITYSYVPSKLELGKSIGMNVPCTAVAVENPGNADHVIKDIASKVTGSIPKEQKAEQPASAQAEQEKPKPKRAPRKKAEPKPEQKPAEQQAAPATQ